MRTLWQALFGVVVLCFSAEASQAELMAYEKGGWIHVAQPDGSKSRKVVRGVYPDLTPDGTKVVFNSSEEKTLDRHIMVADVATGKAAAIPNIPSKNSYGPVWDPKGERVIFQTLRTDRWELAIINADGSDFRVLKFDLPAKEDVWQPTWAADGKSLYVHSLYAVYQVNLDGKVLRKWPAEHFAKEGGFNSGSSLALSPDGKYLLVEVDMNYEANVKDWDGPPPALWKLDLKTEKATNVSPEGVLTWAACWLDDQTILCQGATAKAPKMGIYRVSLTDGSYKLLIPGAWSPNASR